MNSRHSFTGFRKAGPFVLTALFLVLSLEGRLAFSQQVSENAGAVLRLITPLSRPLLLDEPELLSMTRRTVTVTDEKGQKVVYEGVPVAELLKRAKAPLGAKLRGPRLKLYVLAEGADGYGAVFALAEFDPDFTNQVVLLADRRDGHALTAPEGPFRIVAPAEKRHARWVREVQTLELRRAP